MKDNGRLAGSLLAIEVIALILIILLPLPAIVLDILIGLNLIQAILILLIVRNNKKITDFSSLPTVLLVSTLFGLAINIFSVRLILVRGAAFDGWAIRTVASLVAGSGEITHLLIGCACFIVIATVVVIMIIRGNTRILEVAARFTLDSLPGKQMGIEAEHDSGAISEREAALSQMPRDTLCLELGYGLIPLVDEKKNAELLERIQDVRRKVATDMGIKIPMIRILDNMLLDPSEYCLRIKGVDVGRGKIHTEADPPSIIAAHLTEIIQRHAEEIHE